MSTDEKIIYNMHSGTGSTRLRLKMDETLDAAVVRLRKDGWELPDLTKLMVAQDAVGKYIEVKSKA